MILKISLFLALLHLAQANRSCYQKTLSPREIVCYNITGSNFIEPISFVQEQIPDLTTQLVRLEVLHSNVTELKDDSFKLLPNLNIIFLKNVGLKKLDHRAFRGVKRLKQLDLGNNEIEYIPRDLFLTTKLQHLNMDYNLQLKIPTNGPIIYAKDLMTFSLKGCNIEHLSGSAFSQTTSLVILDLSENRLERLPKDIFKGLPLIFLDLTQNQIKKLDYDVFKQVEKTITSLSLKKNPLHCDCKDTKVIDLLVEKDALTDSGIDLMCRTPSKRHGLSWVKHQHWQCKDDEE